MKAADAISAAVSVQDSLVEGDIFVNFITKEESPALFAGVPAMRPHFVGRDKLIAELADHLMSGEVRFLALEGLPGVGKTTLAVALAHHRQVLAHFRDGVLWASLGPREQADPMRALGVWADALGGNVSAILNQYQRQKAVKALISQRYLLLIIDDAWDVEVASALRCGGPNCCHLLTTRDKGIARAFAGLAQVRNVSELDDDTAYELLRQLAPEACQADPAAAQELTRAVGGLPLALELLGGYLAAPERSYFADLSTAALAEIADPKRRLQLAQERLGEQGRKVTLQETIAWSLEDLPHGAVAAFYALGAFAPKPERFSREAAESVAEADAATLALLAARNLVEVEGETLTLHQLLADMARTKLDDYAKARHRKYYLELVNRDREDWQQIEVAYGQIKWAWQCTPLNASRLDWIGALQVYQSRRGLWHDRLNWAKASLSVAKARDRGILLSSMGWAYSALGDREQALSHFQRALSYFRQSGDQGKLADTFNGIGVVYRNMGKHKQALDYFQRALAIFGDIGNPGGMAYALVNIGLAYHNLDDHQKALDHLQRALPNFGEVGDQYGVATALNSVGLVYHKMGQYRQALECYQRASIIFDEVGNRYGKSIAHYHMAKIYQAEGNLVDAVEQLRQAVELAEVVRSSTLKGYKRQLARLEAQLAGKSGNE